MKGKKFYIALIGLFIIGISSIYFYRQQEEARALEFEGFEISSIENRVDALYNAEKTDIQEEIEPKFKELEEIFDELRTKNLRYRNEKQVEELEKQFLTAKEMHDLQIEIGKIFKADDIVRDTISLDNIEALETSLASFEDKTVYFERNSHYISDARVQLETLEEATKQVEALTSDETPIEEVDEEELEKLEELVAQIKDEKKKENLLEQIEAVRTALAEIETEVVLEETDESVEEESEVEETLEDEEAAEAVEEETEAGIEEEAVEEESVETVQETAQATEQPNNTTPPTNDSESNTQQASSNNNRTNTSQTNRSSSNSSTNGSSSNQSGNQTSKPANQQTNNQTKKQTNKQENNQQESQPSKEESKNEESKNEESKNEESKNEEKKETKAVEERPAVNRKYTETNVEDTTPFETLTYRNANITAGEGIVYREGRPGQIIETYEVTEYKNGTSSKRLISREETEPENRVVTIGTKEPETAVE